ncbi:MAG: DUF1592 domain-containing protein [Verrucomicrobiota bacterium]
MKVSFLSLLGVLISGFGLSAEPDTGTFLQSYCTDCHGAEKQKADRRFDTLPDTITTWDHLGAYQEIVDQLNLFEMPPEDEPEPSDEERAMMVAFLQEKIAKARAKFDDAGGHTTLRRLNAWEYKQTIGDLLALDVDAWNPAADFPAEVKSHGFDNNGAQLVTSGMLLGHYFTAAEEAVKRATQFGARPERRSYVQQSPFYFGGKEKEGLPKLFHVDRFRFIPETPYTDLYGRAYRGGHIGFLPTAYGGLPVSGTYTIRVKAAAIDRFHDYGDVLGDFRNGDPLVLELASVDRRGSAESTGNISHEVILKRVELTSEEPQWIEWTGHLEEYYEPEVRFRNGPIAAKRMIRLLTSKLGDRPEFAPYQDAESKQDQAHGILKAHRGPKLRVWEVQVEGPQFEEWPPPGHQTLYGTLQESDLNRETISERLRAFAESAFRRPPFEGELDPIERLVLGKLEEGLPNLEALQLGFQTILCSPGFLYLHEAEGELSAYALASRLSYFLWSSMPDAKLMELAANGSLKSQLREQVDRMLADDRSDRFVTHFVRRWLDLDNIGEMPASKEFLSYYRDNLGEAMQVETETFFRHILDENLPVREFLAADYSFLNRELALHYGIEGVEGNHLQQVSLVDSPNRGGLLGHGLLLTASANGVDTSPVVRGVYLQEKLLGYTPPPPPDDVPEIEPDTRGAQTIREQLEKHRQIATCAECHRKIDPLGFALENYDAVGAWRTQYEGRMPIDSGGKMANGDEFANPTDFRHLMIARSEQFRRCLVEKLLVYALGRDLGVQDRPSIDLILSNAAGLKDVIREVVTCDLFGQN